MWQSGKIAVAFVHTNDRTVCEVAQFSPKSKMIIQGALRNGVLEMAMEHDVNTVVQI